MLPLTQVLMALFFGWFPVSPAGGMCHSRDSSGSLWALYFLHMDSHLQSESCTSAASFHHCSISQYCHTANIRCADPALCCILHFTSIQGKLPHCSCEVLTCLLPLAQTGPCYSLQPAEGWLFHWSESPSYPADHTAQIELWMAVRTPVKRKRKRGRKYIKEWGGWNLKLRLFWGWGINNNKWVVF